MPKISLEVVGDMDLYTGLGTEIIGCRPDGVPQRHGGEGDQDLALLSVAHRVVETFNTEVSDSDIPMIKVQFSFKE